MNQAENKTPMESLNWADYCDAIANQAWVEAHDQGLRTVRKNPPEGTEPENKKPETESGH